MQATFPLVIGAVLKILVGQGGRSNGNGNLDGGGGGGTFVTDINGNPLLIAGGGGGSGGAGYVGGDGVTTTSGGVGGGGMPGGSNGAAGAAGFSTPGAGLTGNAPISTSVTWGAQLGSALAFINGGTGASTTASAPYPAGGFGGGGATVGASWYVANAFTCAPYLLLVLLYFPLLVSILVCRFSFRK